ncbi:MAG TPA: ATP-binding protein [Dongiaceae bacterium]|nr:ATP-binding protein [Dongiaceae bacterium]
MARLSRGRRAGLGGMNFLGPILVLLLLGAAVGIHIYWRQKFSLRQQQWDIEAENLGKEQRDILVQAAAQQQIIFNAMLEGLLLLDCNRRIQLTNRAFDQLFTLPTETRGKTVMEVLRLHELTTLIDRVEAEGQVLGYEMQLPSLQERWLRVNGATISDAAGQREGVILVFHDMTRLKQLEGTRVDFVANVSHELRTPLSMIKGYVETLLGGAKDDPATATKFLQTVERHANRLTLLIEDLLTISSLESGQINLALQPVDLQPTVEKIFTDLKPRAEAKQVQLVNRMPPLTAKADVDRLHQVLSNLVDNAIKYGRTDGRVVVDGRTLDNGKLELHVQDDGPGIPLASQERIFERFYRVDKARSREQGGTGLGLSIVKHIIQAHGGKVWVKSEPGNGATFYFTLPRA